MYFFEGWQDLVGPHMFKMISKWKVMCVYIYDKFTEKLQEEYKGLCVPVPVP